MNETEDKPQQEERPALPTGIWNMELKDDTVIQFYNGFPDKNPLETEPEFDKGDNWSLDVDPDDFADNEDIDDFGDMELELDEDGFVLVPKDQVKSVYFVPYDKDHPAPQVVEKTELADMVNSLAAEIGAFKKDNIVIIPPVHDFEDEPREVQCVRFMNNPFEKNLGKKYVAVRPVDSQKTYLGIYLGNAPIMLTGVYNIPEKEIRMSARTNPQIFIPELMKVVFGYESWWAQIEDEKQLRQITDNDINNVWYVRAMKEMTSEPPKDPEEPPKEPQEPTKPE